MSRPWWKPAQSDYAGRHRVAGIALVVGVAITLLGLAVSSGLLNAALVIVGTSLVVGGFAVAISARRSQQRARQGRGVR